MFIKCTSNSLGRCLIVGILLLGLSHHAFAKRIAPATVEPIVENGVTYSTHFMHGGVVTATDNKTHKLLWQVQVYAIRYNPELETDVQDVFIKAMTLNGHRLLITDEKDHHYALDMTTLRATPENPSVAN